ncbi:11667_t:CDS:2, partial [Dentiscutata erythropus]
MAIVEESSKELATKKQKHDKESKPKRKSLTGVSQVKLAERFSVAEAMISGIVRERKKVLALWVSRANIVFQTITGTIIQRKAIQLAKRLE